MSHAQMIAKAWIDDRYRASLLARGFEVPPRPTDLMDEELDILARSDSYPAPVTACASVPCCCGCE